MFINNRPVKKLKYISNCIQSILKDLQLRKKFILIIDIALDSKDVDVNLSKEKDEARLRNENELIEFARTKFKNLINSLYESVKTILPISQQGTNTIKNTNNLNKFIEKSSEKRNEDDLSPDSDSKLKTNPSKAQTRINKTTNQQGQEYKLIGFSKDKFEQLEIIGQFNKGFIICQLNEELDKLFVVDQHAADEKTNFENLLHSFKLGKQILSQPITLEFTFNQSHIIDYYTDTIHSYGFTIDKISDSKYLVTSMPSFKEVEFSVQDLYDLIQYLENTQNPEAFIYKKVEDELASKACRYSIMIGVSLDHPVMTSVVRRLSKLDAPFNCPHGRPSVFEINQTSFEDSRFQLESILYDFE